MSAEGEIEAVTRTVDSATTKRKFLQYVLNITGIMSPMGPEKSSDQTEALAET